MDTVIGPVKGRDLLVSARIVFMNSGPESIVRRTIRRLAPFS
jgi:hypothetical protein